MGTQVENGKAFEFAIAKKASELLDVPLRTGPAAETARGCFEEKISDTLRRRFQKAASASMGHVLARERGNLEVLNPFGVAIASDATGQKGDVRDVVVLGREGELGISCKTNHDAFKHPRLSGTIDFIRAWGVDEGGCSDEYWEEVRPIFKQLGQLREDSGQTAKWSDIPDVAVRFYWPVLAAFEKELVKHTGPSNSGAAEKTRRLVTYLVGKIDFYKIVARADQVEIQGFNSNGTLSVPETKLPEHIVGIDTLNGGQYSKTVRFDRGFTFNFRIHSASSRVEPSLKFDVRAISLPPADIYTHHISI